MKKQAGFQQSYADAEAETLSLAELLDSVEKTASPADDVLNKNQAAIEIEPQANVKFYKLVRSRSSAESISTALQVETELLL